MLNPSSRLKGEKDMEKYEKARRLKSKVAKIREDYTAGKMVLYDKPIIKISLNDIDHGLMVMYYLIDTLALPSFSRTCAPLQCQKRSFVQKYLIISPKITVFFKHENPINRSTYYYHKLI
jgi:hypothetical protein